MVSSTCPLSAQMKGSPKTRRLPRGKWDTDFTGTTINCPVRFSGLASLLRSKEHVEFLSLLSQLCTSLLNGIKGIQAQNSILIEALKSLQ